MKKVLSHGFTLIELLVVISILGVLATVAIVNFSGSQVRARDAKRQSDLKQYQNALETFAVRNNSIYPASLDTDADTVCGASYLDIGSCPSDVHAASGWDDYHYTSNATGIEYVLWAHLEHSDEYFVLCSTGQAGNATSEPSGSSCPL